MSLHTASFAMLRAMPHNALRGPFAQRIVNERWLIVIFVAACATRLHWNLVVHPLGDYIYSDMGGYVSRAHALLNDWSRKTEYNAFYPFGTHWLLAGIKAVFGRENYTAVGIVWALLGGGAVAFTFAAARRATAFPAIAVLVGLLGIFYYPHLSIGGYVLSEGPFSFFLSASLVGLLRLIDTGHKRDAVFFGLSSGLGFLIRPQITVSLAMLGLFWLWRRRSFPNVRLSHLALGGIFIVACMGLSTWHNYHHTGRYAVTPENGSFNLVFGRCHPVNIRSLPDGKGHGKVSFGVPSFIQLRNAEKRLQQEQLARGDKGPLECLLCSALGHDIEYKGYIGDKVQHHAFVRQCIAQQGWWRQIQYSIMNARLLWEYNVAWPDSGRRAWIPLARTWANIDRVLAIPALLGLLMIFFRRTRKQALFSIHLLALVTTAAIFFGSCRIRSPYGLIIVFLACETVAWAGALLGGWIAKRRSSSVSLAAHELLGKPDEPHGQGGPSPHDS